MTHMEAKQRLNEKIIEVINESCLSISAVRNVLYNIDSILDRMEEDEYQKTILSREKKEGEEDDCS